MAQTAVVEIPAQFIFRPCSARWIKCAAEIVGWSDTLPPHPELDFAPRTTDGENAELVHVKLNVPSSAKDTPDPAGAYPLAPCYTFDVDRASIPPDVLMTHENRRNTPDISGRALTVLTCPIPEFKSLLWIPAPGMVRRDAWKMRDEFLNLSQGIEELRLFLNHWGFWDSGRGYNEMVFGKSPHGFAIVFPHLLWKRQELYRSALIGKPDTWLRKNSLSIRHLSEPPYFLVQRFYCEDAIKATITIDHLSRVRFGICRRNDCRTLFQRQTLQKRIYCTPACAHLANVRKLRAKRKNKLKGEPRNANR